MALLLNRYLSGAGYETLLLSAGDYINEHIARFCPDLILMDVMLAGMDGRDICRLLKANPLFQTPVILISGTHNLEQVMSQQGAPNDFIAKPFDIDILLNKVKAQIPE